ncbi:MAG TPA: nuclear transport factor 2 family protein [Caulobacteraceae bacterium]|nr:nuclear transport factor 2 family protein [Caulobacteraceae bacterium]
MTATIDITARNRAIVTEAFEGLARGDTRAYAAAMAEDFTWRPMGSGAWGKVYEGRKAVREQLFGPLFAQYEPGSQATLPVNIFADGDHVVVEAQGQARMKDGRRYDNRYCFVITLKDGKMTEVREYLDTLLSETTLDASVL